MWRWNGETEEPQLPSSKMTAEERDEFMEENPDWEWIAQGSDF